MRAQLQTACTQAECTARQVNCSVSAGSSTGFHSAWVTFRKEALAYAKRVTARAPLAAAAPTTRSTRLTAAARVRAGAMVRQQQAAEASAATVLRVQSAITRSAAVIRARDAGRAAFAAAALASTRAASVAPVCLVEGAPARVSVRPARRAQVLATVLRGRPLRAEAVGAVEPRGLVRERTEGLRGIDA